MLTFRVFCESADYRGLHTAPSPRNGAPLYRVTHNIYPDDVYDQSVAVRYYGTGNRTQDIAAFRIVWACREKPEAPVTIYRAVPATAAPHIHAGDWVTIVRQYAVEHGESTLRGDYQILSHRVRARELWTNGDSIMEWGYWPNAALLPNE